MCWLCAEDDELIAALRDNRQLTVDERERLIARLEQLKDERAEASGEGL